MVLNDIIADYQFVSSTLENCEEYFLKCTSIIENYIFLTFKANTSFFSNQFPNDKKSILLFCYDSIISLNSSTYTFYSCLALLNSKRYNTEIVANEISYFNENAQSITRKVNEIIEQQFRGFRKNDFLPFFMKDLQKFINIYNELKNRATLLFNIDHQLFESLPTSVEENSLRIYELRSYKNSLDFNDYAEDLHLINRFITQLSSFAIFNTPIYTRKIESGSLRIVWSGGEVEINCISDIINALVNGIRNIAFLPSDIKLKKQDVRKASLENDGIAIENISRKLAIVNSQIDILAEKLGLDKNNSEDIEKIQLLCTPLIDYLGNNPIGNINGVEYDLKNDLKYLTCNTRLDEQNN